MEEGVLTILQEKKSSSCNWNELGSEMRPKQTGVLKTSLFMNFFIRWTTH